MLDVSTEIDCEATTHFLKRFWASRLFLKTAAGLCLDL